ncbi:MAG: hypothetical protein J5965_07690 [Aeriscardovia sp.]|nr:hypothetical protein [Aeriscardovia sp.]MBP3832835.1 hypothetical protein [Bacteroidaceae bacterium]
MNKIVDNLCDGLAAAGTAAIAATSSSPEGALVMEVAAPFAGGFLKAVVNSVERLITSRGEQRIDVMAHVAYETLQQNLHKGLSYRKDNLFIRIKDQCEFEEIFEGIIRAVSSDCDQAKSAIYGRFLGNIPFHPECKINKLRNMKDTIQSLTSFELCVLSLYYKRVYLGTMEIDKYIDENPDSIASDIFVALKKLSTNSCLSSIVPTKMTAEVLNYVISQYGKDVCILTQLDDTDNLYPELHKEIYMIDDCLRDICHLSDNDPVYDDARKKYLRK